MNSLVYVYSIQITSCFLCVLDHSHDHTSSYYHRPKKISVLPPDYLKEAYRQLDDKEVSEQFSNDPSVLANTLMKALEKICLRGGFAKGHFLLFSSSRS